MTTTDTPQASPPPPAPSDALKRLDKLAGKWKISGPYIDGLVTYEWLPGRFFLVQNMDLVHGGHVIQGIEVIGQERLFGAAEAGEDIKARVYDNDGDTLDYVYELEGDTLTIWGGQKGSPAFFRGTFSNDGNVLAGAWQWPGGGYESTATRIK